MLLQSIARRLSPGLLFTQDGCSGANFKVKDMKYSIRLWIFSSAMGIFVNVWGHKGFFWTTVVVSTWMVSTIIMRYFIFRHVDDDTRYRNKETVLVTGASCGIGAQIASILASRGGKVIWTGRDTKKAQRVLDDLQWTFDYGPRGYVLYLDLASKKEIENFVDNFKRREMKLNCIILNAAYHGTRRVTADGFEQTIGVNHLGHMYLVYLLIELLKKSTPARVIVITSDLHKLVKNVRFDDLMFEKNYSGFSCYNHSKLLNILFARELARRLKGTGITVYAVHPGTPIKSELMRDTWMNSFLIDKVLMPPICWLFCRSAYDGAQTPVYCACSQKCAEESGKYYDNLRADEPSNAATDDEAALKLWDVSCELLQIPKDWL